MLFKKKDFLRLIGIVAVIAISTACSDNETGVKPPTLPPDTRSTSPPSSKLSDGVNLQPSYYNGGDVTFAWNLMAKYKKIKTIRIEIEPNQATQAITWIKEALAHGHSVIATYHKSKANGSDDASDLIDAANWWEENYKKLVANGPITINLMNEWGDHKMTPANYAAAYNKAIKEVRTVYDNTHTIILDVPGYGQDVQTATRAVTGEGIDTKIKDQNIMLSVHIYPNGYNGAINRALEASDLAAIASAGVKGIIGEFCDKHPNGKSDWMNIVQYAENKNWPVIGWAWNGDGNSMNMILPGWGTEANASDYRINPDYFQTIYQQF